MATEYSLLFNSVLSKLKDYSLGEKTDEEIYNILAELIRPACVRFWACKQDLTNRNDELRIFNIDLTDMEFEILTNFMLIQYIDSNKIRIPELMELHLSSRDFAALHQQEQLNRMRELHELCIKENEQLISMYSINGSSKIWNKDIDPYIPTMRNRGAWNGFRRFP